MLSSSELIKALEAPNDAAQRLAVVPKPNIETIQKRAGTSIDLRLGRWFRTFKQTHHSRAKLVRREGAATPKLVGSRLHFIRFGKNFTLHPGRFVLASTLEWVKLGPGLSAYITGKSSLGRHGLVIETASGIHPGFSGCLTLEMANVGEIPVQVYPGMEVCQVFFHPVPYEKPKKGDEVRHNLGQFSGKRRPTIKAPSADFTLDALSYGGEDDEDD